MRRLLKEHLCTSVQARGWSGIRNSDLLARAEGALIFSLQQIKTSSISKTLLAELSQYLSFQLMISAASSHQQR